MHTNVSRLSQSIGDPTALLARGLVAMGWVAPTAFGLILGWLQPRGALTSTAALGTMAASIAIGFLSGAGTRSRLAALISPLTFLVAFEFSRVGVDGPTVDAVRLTSTYGLVAFVVGRGFDAVLTLTPLSVGAAYGRMVVGRFVAPVPGPSRWLAVRWAGRAALAGSTLALVGLVILIARPASTPDIVDPDGRSVPGSVAELTSVDIGGHDQALLLRGWSADNPVLLYLAGGPGGTDLGVMRIFGAELERHFVVATWDQRGSGKSHSALDPTGTLTLDGAISNAIEVTEYLRERFDEDKIYLVGNSWGSTLGVLAAQRRPELFHAYVGTGQMVSQRATDRIYYADTIAWAESRGDHDLMERLRQQGPPPYDDLWKFELVFAYERQWNDYDRVPEYDAKGELPASAFTSEYTLVEQVRTMGAFLETFALLYPQLQEIDFRDDAATLDIPVFMIAGAHETHGRAVLADEWFEMLDAPLKRRFTFEHSGHRPLFEEPERFAEVMTLVLAETYPYPETTDEGSAVGRSP